MAAASEEKNLTKRYLIWCYKTTKEEFDRIERKFTQLDVDYFVLDCLEGIKKESIKTDWPSFQKHVQDFKEYIAKKEQEAFPLKFADNRRKVLQPQYIYLQNRLKSVEKAIIKFLGRQHLNQIKALYENEMTRRILEAREHA